MKITQQMGVFGQPPSKLLRVLSIMEGNEEEEPMKWIYQPSHNYLTPGHSGESRNPVRFLDAPASSTGQAYQVRHDEEGNYYEMVNI